MKKFLTIGRNPACDICIPDSSNVVSREHAVLEIGKGGKYYLIDKSRNGTYVNGIKMSANERIPVSREDEISFAHVGNLDWSLVPKNNTATVWVVSVIGAVVVLGLCGWGIAALVGSSHNRIDIYGDQPAAERWNDPQSVSEDQDAETPAEQADSVAGESEKAVQPVRKPEKKSPKKSEKKTEQPETEDPVWVDALY